MAGRFGEIAGDALRYWERRRPIYNGVLFAVVLIEVGAGWPASRSLLTLDSLLGAFLLAVLSNVAYCAAYAADLFVQFAGLRDAWTRWRWAVLAVGCAFGATITHFMVAGAINEPHVP